MTPTEEIKAKLDIVEYIGKTVRLMPSGKSMRGLCPFHKEKTPSFYVSRDKQMWYCFGCHKGGDLFKFVMELERVEFSDALRMLADRAGVVLRREDPQLRTLKARVLEALKECNQFFRSGLSTFPQALEYLVKRGLTIATINEFQLGFAPAGWHNLYLLLRQKGFSDFEIEQAGVALKSTGAQTGQFPYYDRFRNRVMFPIFDHTGAVVGFSGRILPQEGVETVEAKYINTPETAVYSKGKILYGFQASQEAIREKNEALLVEGNTDFLAAWQNGIKNVAAVSGTALGDEQLGLLRRFCNTLLLGFDMDSAGEMATDRSIALALQKGFAVQVVRIPEGKDLADYFLTHPNDASTVLAHPDEVMEYYFAAAVGPGLKTVDDRKRAVTYFLPRIKSLASSAERSHWLHQLATATGIDEKMLVEEFNRVQPISSIVSAGDSGIPSASLFFQSRWDALAETVLAFALRFPQLRKMVADHAVSFPFRFQDAARNPERIDAELASYLALRADFELALMGSESENPAFVEREARSLMAELNKEALRNRMREITVGIQEAESAGQGERLETLSAELNRLTQAFTVVETDNSHEKSA